MELAGKRVVITGASRGIGAEIARVFASAGSQVVVSARTESAITELASEVGGVAVPFDANDPNDVRSYIDSVESIAGPIDVLINNAGILGTKFEEPMKGAFGSVDYESWEETLRVNVLGPFRVCEAFVNQVSQSQS